MILQVIGRALGMFLIAVCVLACILVPSVYMLRWSEKADSRFEVSMDKDIDRVAGELKEAGLNDKTVQILEYALRDIQQNTESYVNSKSSTECSLVLFLAITLNALLIVPLSFAAMNRKNAMTNLSITRPRFIA